MSMGAYLRGQPELSNHRKDETREEDQAVFMVDHEPTNRVVRIHI